MDKFHDVKLLMSIKSPPYLPPLNFTLWCHTHTNFMMSDTYRFMMSPLHISFHDVILHILQRHIQWDTINTGPGPRTGDPRTRGPEDRGPKDPDSWGLCWTVAVKNTTIQAISANATCLTHNYVLYVVAMHTEGVIYSRQRYSLTFLILSQACTPSWHSERESVETIRIWPLTPGSQCE